MSQFFFKDKNLKPENIRKGVKIGKVTGTLEGGVTPTRGTRGTRAANVNNQDITADSSTLEQVFTYDEGYDGIGIFTLLPYLLQSRTVSSSTSSQTITPGQGYDGLYQVIVSPYTLESRTVNSSTTSQTVTPGQGYDGLSSVTVNPYTLDTKSVDPSTVSQTVNSSADGMSSVSISAVTSSIDSNIQAGNIKDGVTILGVTGNMASGDWVANARKNSVNISSKTLTGGTHTYAYANLFSNWKQTSSSRTLPQIAGTQCLDHEFSNTFSSTGRLAINDYTIPFTTIGSHGMDSFLHGVNIDINNYNNTVLFPNLTTIGDYGLYEAFYGNGGIRWASMPNLETVGSYGLYKTFSGNSFGYGKSTQPDFISSIKKIRSYGMQSCFEGCSYLNYGISFDNLDNGYDINGTASALSNCFKGTGITSITFPKLAWVGGTTYFINMCQNCTSLTSVSFPEFYMENAGNVFYGAFSGCTSLTSVSFPKYREVRYGNTFNNTFPNRAISFNVHPGAVTRTDQGNIVYGLSAVTTITLSEDATVDIHLDWQPSLSFSTVYGILSRLDPSASAKSCTFYTSGLTVTDDLQGTLQTAYNAAVNAGWTINNLTINPSYMKITSPSDGDLDLGTSNTISFDTVSSWTAVTSSNDIVLDSYSGSAGLAQSVTVTTPSNWEGIETVTFTCNNVDTVVRVYNYDNLTFLTKITTNNDVIDIAKLTTNATVFSADMQRKSGGGNIVSNNGGTTTFNLWISGGSYYPKVTVDDKIESIWAYHDRRYQDFRGGLDTAASTFGYVFIGYESNSSYNSNTVNFTATDTPMCAGDAGASFDFYGLKHYENWKNHNNRVDSAAVLVHDYKPASKNNVCGFFDDIEKKWYPCRNGLVTGTV